MNNDDKIVKLAAIGFIGLVVAPAVIGGTITLIGNTAIGINNIVEKRRFNKKIKKGLKDGSIVEVDGKYYTVSVNNVEEA